MFKFSHIEDYLKKRLDSAGKREYLRIPSKIPVLYSFGKGKKSGKDEFRQCYTTNISGGGIAITVIDAPSTLSRMFQKMGQKIALKIEIPRKDKLINCMGAIKWCEIMHEKQVLKHEVGIIFNTIDPNDKIDLLSFAVALIRRKVLAKISMIFLIVSVIVTGVWAMQSNLAKKVIHKKFVISKDIGSKLRQDIISLIRKRDKLQEDLEKNEQDMERQKQLIKERRLYLDNSKYILLDIYKEWNIDTLESLMIFDGLYKKGRKAFKEKNYKSAIGFYEKLIQNYPDTLLGYRLLAQALYSDMQTEKADAVFKKYMEKIKKQVINP
ncbi:MAG: PilZ domain-containing protein [Spirochaetes bacterium]|nr:PilZ domain-containing protein [Spirochaetota bacterium]